MKLDLAGSTSQNIVGVRREPDLLFLAIIYGNTDMLTGLLSQLPEIVFFLVLPYCNTDCTNVFLRELSKQYDNDMILLCCDGAAWHKSKTLCVPENIVLFFIPPYTPEMNPIEQIWKEIRKRGFKNEIFSSLSNVIDRLCDIICSLSAQVVKSITGRDWILNCLTSD